MSNVLSVIRILFCLSIYTVSYSQSVDPLTGRAVINIPLASVSSRDLSIPVSLSHHGGALKVTEGPGNAGMGFNLYFGQGYISRVVQGLPDDYVGSGGDTRTGWLYNANAASIQNFSPQGDDNLGVCTDEANDWNFINSLGYLKDPEPDIFFFSAPGGVSGKFVFGSDGQPKLTPYQDLKIDYNVGSGFTITTNTGIKYNFSVAESVERQAVKINPATTVNLLRSQYNYFEKPVTFVSTWHLQTIQSTATGASVIFNYTSGMSDYSSSFVTSLQPTDSTRADTLYMIKDRFYPLQLDRVDVGDNYRITADWENARVVKLSVVHLPDNESRVFDFIYDHIFSLYDTRPEVLRNAFLPFLKKVVQQNSCTAYPAYVFAYYAVDTVANTAPAHFHSGYGQDMFGYNNGRPNEKNIPRIFFYSGESGARRFRLTPINGLTPQVFAGGNASRRIPDSLAIQVGALTAIYYPTGGRTSFEYEINKYRDASTGETLLGPGIRVKSVSTSGGDYQIGKTQSLSGVYHSLTTTYSYIDAAGGSSGKLEYPPVYAFTDGTKVYRSLSDLGPGGQVLYGRVVEKIPSKGYRTYEYDLSGMYPDPGEVINKVARKSGQACNAGILKNGVYTFPFASVNGMDFKRGYITRLSEYKENGALTSEKRFSYSLPQSNAVVKGLKFESFDNAQGQPEFHFSVYSIPVNQSKILVSETSKQIGDLSAGDSSKTSVSYIYNTKNLLTRSTQTNNDGSSIDTYYKYAGDYNVLTPAAGDQQANALFKLNSTGRSGEVIETYQSLTPIGGSATYTGGSLTIFKDFGTRVLPVELKRLLPASGAFTPSSVSGSPQTFLASNFYLSEASMDYLNTLPVNRYDRSLIPTGTHYTNGDVPIATFVNCKAENAIFDGFEYPVSRGLSAAAVFGPPRTGSRSATLTTGAFLTSTATTKSGNLYRISLWAHGASSATVTVKAKSGSTVQATLNLNYTSANQWSYLEGMVDMSSVSNSFVLEISSSATISIDDFVALPKSARVSHSTYRAFAGVTSNSDDRGNSTVIEYDGFGRKKNVFDRARNLVELTEYGLQKSGGPELNAGFTVSTNQYVRDEAATFTAIPTCVPQVSYSWTFTDAEGVVTTATGNPVVKSFTRFGAHSVKLTVSSPGYGSKSQVSQACVGLPSNFTANISVSPSNVYHQCSPSESSKTFTATGSFTGGAGLQTTYTWEMTDANGQFQVFFPPGAVVNGNQLHIPSSPLYSYTVRCTISIRGIPDYKMLECTTQEVKAIATAGITFYPQSQCQ